MSDGELTDTASVTINVTAVNDAPVAVDDGSEMSGIPVDEDGMELIDVLDNDIDVDGDEISITSVGTPENGTAVIEDGQIKYTPDVIFLVPIPSLIQLATVSFLQQQPFM